MLVSILTAKFVAQAVANGEEIVNTVTFAGWLRESELLEIYT